MVAVRKAAMHLLLVTRPVYIRCSHQESKWWQSTPACLKSFGRDAQERGQVSRVQSEFALNFGPVLWLTISLPAQYHTNIDFSSPSQVPRQIRSVTRTTFPLNISPTAATYKIPVPKQSTIQLMSLSLQIPLAATIKFVSSPPPHYLNSLPRLLFPVNN